MKPISLHNSAREARREKLVNDFNREFRLGGTLCSKNSKILRHPPHGQRCVVRTGWPEPLVFRFSAWHYHLFFIFAWPIYFSARQFIFLPPGGRAEMSGIPFILLFSRTFISIPFISFIFSVTEMAEIQFHFSRVVITNRV